VIYFGWFETTFKCKTLHTCKNLLNIVIGCLSWPIPRENTDYYYPIIPRLGVCGSKFPLFVAYFVQSSWIGDGHNSGEIFSVWRFMVQLRCFWIPTPRIGWSNPISLGRSTVEAQFSVSADRCVTEWNHRLADVTGKDKEAVAGKLAFTWVGCWRPICGVSPIEMGLAVQSHVLRFQTGATPCWSPGVPGPDRT